MRRILLAAAIFLTFAATAAPVQARWGHHCGWGGYGGYRGCGYGGYSVGYRGCGYGGWGGYCGPRYVGYSCYQPCYGVGIYSGYCGGYYGYGTSVYYGGPVSIGYYGLASPSGPYYNPQANFVSNYAAARPITLRVTTIAADKPTVSREVRISNPDQFRRAADYLAQGDELFRGQKFHSALQKYKLAAGAAPDLAEAYWRQGHALIATSNFDLAAGAFKRAIGVDPDARRTGFTLDKLYGTASMAKTAHVEQLAAWAMEHAESSDAYFLVGVTLAYDGQAERAAKFFRQAADMAGVAGGHIAAFNSAPDVLFPAEKPARVVPVSAEVEI